MVPWFKKARALRVKRLIRRHTDRRRVFIVESVDPPIRLVYVARVKKGVIERAWPREFVPKDPDRWYEPCRSERVECLFCKQPAQVTMLNGIIRWGGVEKKSESGPQEGVHTMRHGGQNETR